MSQKNQSVPAEMPPETVEKINPALVDPSPFQPRKTFDPAKLEELKQSVAGHGIIVPLLCRPSPGGEGRVELVDGERRLRVAVALKLALVPVIQRPMTDEQVMETQTLAFLHHADLHPMEEARAYERLMTACGHTVDAVAAKTGKARRYIVQRLKLCALAPEAEKLFVEGKLTVDTAFLVATIPAKLQPKAAGELSGKQAWDKQPMSLRQAREHVERNYRLRLADAGFSKTSATLVSAAGACSTCPKRTGNDKDLFGEVGSADLCTDPACFKEKHKQHIICLRLRLEKSGRTVLPEKDGAKLYNDYGLHYGAPYVEAEAKCYEDPKRRTFKQLLGKDAAPVVAIDRKGRAHDVIAKDRVAEALKKAGVKTERGGDSYDAAAERAKRQEQEAVDAIVRQRFQEAVCEAARDIEEPRLYRWLAAKVLDLFDYEDCNEVAAVRRYPSEDKDIAKAMQALEKAIPSMSVVEARGLVAELLASLNDKADAEMFKVNVKALEKAALAEIKVQKAEKKRPAKDAKDAKADEAKK